MAMVIHNLTKAVVFTKGTVDLGNFVPLKDGKKYLKNILFLVSITLFDDLKCVSVTKKQKHKCTYFENALQCTVRLINHVTPVSIVAWLM